MYILNEVFTEKKNQTYLNQMNGQTNILCHLAMRQITREHLPSKLALHGEKCALLLDPVETKHYSIHIVRDIQLWSEKVSSISQYRSEFTVTVTLSSSKIQRPHKSKHFAGRGMGCTVPILPMGFM